MADFWQVARERIGDALEKGTSKLGKLQAVCELLVTHVPYYDWVGFYVANPELQTLSLGPYAGASTEHTDIPYGRGICGQVAVSEQLFMVPDVRAEDNYLSCSPTVKSEIVVPVMSDGRFVAQLDIDSEQLDPFTSEDLSFLEEIAGLVAPLFA
jgi:L-methionine (R)-S-oxide reductase